MTRTSLLLTSVCSAALLALAACSASAPPVRLHTLMPPEPAPRIAAAGAATIAIALDPIRVPAQVDQQQWLVRLSDDSLAVLEQERWAGPLPDELRLVVLEELAARYGAVEAVGPAASAAARLRIVLELRRFDSVPGREARIEATWTVAVGSAAPSTRCDALVREAALAGMPALAAAHRRAVVRLADAIGSSLVAVRSGAGAACPAADPR
ncbi:MAG: PqiC family protein [Caldimonas sp.]